MPLMGLAPTDFDAVTISTCLSDTGVQDRDKLRFVASYQNVQTLSMVNERVTPDTICSG